MKCRIKTGECLKITGSQVHCRSGSILKAVQDKDVFTTYHYHHNRFTALFQDHPGEPVPEENFWTLWCKGRLTEADTLTIRLGATPSGVNSAHLHHPPIFLQAGCTLCRPTNSVKALKATLQWVKLAISVLLCKRKLYKVLLDH